MNYNENEFIDYRINQFRNTSCDLSDWEPSTLSFHPKSSDTIVSLTYSIHSRYGLQPVAANGDRCSSRLDPRPTVQPATTYQTTYRPTRPTHQTTRPTYSSFIISEDGQSMNYDFGAFGEMQIRMADIWPANYDSVPCWQLLVIEGFPLQF